MERRRNRSQIVGEALDLLLKSSAQRHQIANLVLSDEHGLVVASNGHSKRAEELAIAGRLKAEGEGALRWGKMDYSSVGVHSFEVQEQKLYLSWAGASTARLLETETGIQRILSRRTIE
jgi:hypothetical protein